MKESLARNPRIAVDPEAFGTLKAYNRSIMVEVMRHVIEDIADATGEIPPELSVKIDKALKSWPDLMAREKWPDRDQTLVFDMLDGFYNIDKTLMRAVRGAPVPLEHVMAGVERSAFEAVISYETMAQLLNQGMLPREGSAAISIVMQKMEIVGRLTREATQKIAQGERTHITARLDQMMKALPIYAGQLALVAKTFGFEELKALMSVRELLNAWPKFMGRPLPPEIATMLQQINSITN